MTDQAKDVVFEEGVVQAGGCRLRYWSAGQGEPLVHLHGAGGAVLTPAHGLLAQRFRMIRLELPGFGPSTITENIATAGDVADVVAEALTALDLEQVDLLGSSLGGKIACWVALRHQDRLKALALEAPAAFRPRDARPLSQIPPQEMPGLLYAHPERITPAPVDPAERARIGALVGRLLGSGWDDELEARLGEITLQTLVMFGTDDGLVPPEMGRIYKEKIPNATYALVYDAGHVIQQERPEAFARIVGDFLEHHAGWIVNRESALIHP